MTALDTVGLEKLSMYIGGESTPSDSGETFETFNPFTGKPWALVARGNAVIEKLAGPDALYVVEGVTPFFSEDFSQFQQHMPGALYYLGVSNSANGTMGLPHSPAFVADEGAIVFGARTMSAILIDYLENH